MKHMVSYKLKPDRVAENERLAMAVYDALKQNQPPGLAESCPHATASAATLEPQ